MGKEVLRKKLKKSQRSARDLSLLYMHYMSCQPAHILRVKSKILL